MNLKEALERISYAQNWEVWAELIDGKLTEESPARFGQSCFEQGGLLDDCVLVCNGETIGDHCSEWKDDDGNLVDGWFDEFVDPLNESQASALSYAQ